MTSTTPPVTVPNHHAHHPGFSGLAGALGALSMAVGRGSDARLAARLVDLGPDDHLVDIGCGPGAALTHAASIGARATGIDPAPVMRRFARLRALGRRRIEVRDGAAEALPLPDASATVAWSLATVHHWPDIDGGLAEVRRVLRPGGRFLAIERLTVAGATGLAGHGWTEGQAEAFADACRRYGFVDVVVELHAGTKGTGHRRRGHRRHGGLLSVRATEPQQ